MPLPHIKTFCCAKCKATGNTCLNPAAFGMRVCRYHGAKKPDAVRRGAAHGRYKSGAFTQTAKDGYRQASVRLMELQNLGFGLGMMLGKRTPGRKPGAN